MGLYRNYSFGLSMGRIWVDRRQDGMPSGASPQPLLAQVCQWEFPPGCTSTPDGRLTSIRVPSSAVRVEPAFDIRELCRKRSSSACGVTTLNRYAL